jgi:hypothetical protein
MMNAYIMRCKQAMHTRHAALCTAATLARGGGDLKPFATNMMANVMRRWGLDNMSGSCIASDVRAGREIGTIYYPGRTSSFERLAEVTRVGVIVEAAHCDENTGV